MSKTLTRGKKRNGIRPATRPTAALPQTFSQPDAWAYVGVARAVWFRIRSAGELPDPVFLPGSTWPRWRRRDLDKFLDELGNTRQREPVPQPRKAGRFAAAA